ncbi:SAM-dependent methyltransferase [Spirillospora sp. NPDC052242]
MTVEAGAVHGADALLYGPAVFRAAALVRDRITVEASGRRHPLSPVSAGFVALRTDPPASGAHRIASTALAAGRPVALVGRAAARTAASLADATGGHWLRPPGPAPGGAREPWRRCHFVVPGTFVAARAAAIRRLHRDRRPRVPPPFQLLTAVGVGPWVRGDGARVRRALARAEAVVATDWTFRNTLPALGLRTTAGRHAVPYDAMNYDATVTGISDTVDRLQDAGVGEVVLLVEGNPDTYDVLEGLSPVRRRLVVVPGVPIGLAAAGELGRSLARDPFDLGYAYLSGLPARHGQTREHLLRELAGYLAAGLPCALVEMTAGDIGLVLRAARDAPEPMTCVLLSDLYSPDARVVTAGAAEAGARTLLEHARGRLTTLLVFKESFRAEPLR